MTIFITPTCYAQNSELRPATELEEINIISAVQLDQLMKEAETIMEGWDLGYDRADDADE